MHINFVDLDEEMPDALEEHSAEILEPLYHRLCLAGHQMLETPKHVTEVAKHLSDGAYGVWFGGPARLRELVGEMESLAVGMLLCSMAWCSVHRG